MLTIVIVLSTSVLAFADTIVYISSSSDLPTFYVSFGSTARLNILSESSFKAKYASLDSMGFPVEKVEISLDNSTYTVIRLTDYVQIKYLDGSNYGGISSGHYLGDANGGFAYEKETTYDVVGIAGASNYYQTNRPAGTVGNGYLGDLQVTYNEWMNIKNELDSISGTRFYYAMGHSINGQYRYYMTPSGMSDTYYVCNSAGQLFYYLKDEGSTEDPGGGGSTFDPTEVITAINSVYDAINSQGSRLSARFTELITSTNSISNTLNMHMNNVVGGFDSLQGQLTTLSSYFSELSGLFPVQETLTLSGSDARVAWDSADRITDVSLSGFGDGDLTVKQYPGALVDESGYEKVTINETEYTLSTEQTGYRTITANNEYPDTGVQIPENTFFYFSFDESLSSTVNDISFDNNVGEYSFVAGVNGDAIQLNANTVLRTPSLNASRPSSSSPFTLSFWFYTTSYATTNDGIVLLRMKFGNSSSLSFDIMNDGALRVWGASLVASSSTPVTLNSWNHVAFTYDSNQVYLFLNGNVVSSSASNSLSWDDGSFEVYNRSSSVAVNRLDELLFLSDSCLWTSDFNPDEDAIFASVVSNYFLACEQQNITLNFYDTDGSLTTEHRWNMYEINTSRLPDGYTELDSIRSTGGQYLLTGFIPNNNTRVVMDCDFTASGSETMPFGSSDTNGNYFYPDYTGGKWVYLYGTAVASSSSSVTGRVTIDANQNVLTVNGVSVTATSQSFTGNYPIMLFGCNIANSFSYTTTMTLYSCQIYDNDTLVRDFVPCTNPNGVAGLYDLVNGVFYDNDGTGTFSTGSVVSNGSSIGNLVGVVSSSDINAYPQDGEQDGFYYEYIGEVTDYPYFSQTLSPTDVNGNAITMGRLMDDFSEIYYDVETSLWMCHDPQTQTEILLSSANQEIMNDTIYIRQNYVSYVPDQVTANTLQSAFPVDAPVYVDMPESAKVTITYDHYSGWFRMMYLLMDKQTQLLTDLDIVNETIVDIDNTVIEISPDNDAFNIFYIEKTDGSKESVGDAAMDVAKVVGDALSMFYRLVFEDALSNKGVLNDFEDTMSGTLVGVDVWS